MNCLKIFFGIFLVLIGNTASAQRSNAKTAEDREFYRQVQLTKEYKKIKMEADSINADPNSVPCTYQLLITKPQDVGEDKAKLIHGELSLKLAIGVALSQYHMAYDRIAKKITVIEGGGNPGVEIKR